jgi:hypothetical protein
MILAGKGEGVKQTRDFGLPLPNIHYEACVLVGSYAAYSGNSFPAFRHKLSFPSSTVNKS